LNGSNVNAGNVRRPRLRLHHKHAGQSPRKISTLLDVHVATPQPKKSVSSVHLATLVTGRGGDPAKALRMLDGMVGLVDLVSPDIYSEHDAEAKRRIGSRDPDDWPTSA
jgi:hypothetical protein